MDPTPPVTHIKRSFKNPAALGLFASLLFLFPYYAHAASLSLFPATANVDVGQEFTLSVYVSTPEQAMNAASGDISFPSDKLQVLSISKRNSIISLWIRDPSFTNSVTGGDVHFEGVVLNPGFTGSAGDLITITFEAVGTGTGTISFSSGAVLANDGNGTNILDDLQSANVIIGPRPLVPAVPNTTNSSSTKTGVSTSTPSSTEPVVVIQYPPQSNKWKEVLRWMVEWGAVILFGLLLLSLVIFLAIIIIHRIKKWRLSSGRDLLLLEEILRNDLKRIKKELDTEKLGQRDPVRTKIEHIESDIKKDIQDMDDLKKN